MVFLFHIRKKKKMKVSVLIFLMLLNFIPACSQDNKQTENPLERINGNNDLINPNGKTVETRFLLPPDYERIKTEEKSFYKYLRELPLKPHGSDVLFFDGKIKENKNIYDGVIDLKIGDKDLHQCADAIMRLRAEYLFGIGNYDKIHFNFTNGFLADYSEWMKGKRIVVKVNRTYWKQTTTPSNTYNDFWKYMEIIFTYAGTYSLSNELIPVNIDDLKIGDIFIQGGFPGHAVIVVNMAVNPKTNEKIFLLAQSYMPAQELQILKNPNDENISPWYSVNFQDELRTPEWKFQKSDLKRFGD